MGRLAGDEHAADGYAIPVGPWLVAPETVAAVHARAAEMAAGDGARLGAVAAACGIDPPHLRACLARASTLTVEGDTVRVAGRPGLHDEPVVRRFLAALAVTPWAPPSPAALEVSPPTVRALVHSGAVVDLDGLVFSAGALADARTRVARLVVEQESVTLADVRSALGTTRRHAVAIVNRMDAEGVTRRRGDVRIAGPRAR
jgi:selenocysteine-specific elongation factor